MQPRPSAVAEESHIIVHPDDLSAHLDIASTASANSSTINASSLPMPTPQLAALHPPSEHTAAGATAAAGSCLVGSTASAPADMQPVAAAQQDSHAQLGAAAPAADAQLLGLDRDIRGVTHALTAGANLADWRPYQPIGKAATAIRKQRRAERRARQQQEELEQWMAWQLEYEEQQQQLDPTMRAEYSRPVSSEVPEGLHGECVVLFETFTPKAQEEAFKWLEEQPDAVYALLQPPSP